MSWLQRSNKKSKRSRKTAKHFHWRWFAQNWDSKHTLRALRLIAVVAAVGGLTWGGGSVRRHLADYAVDQQGGAVSAEVVLVDAPLWLELSSGPDGLHQGLQRVVAEHISDNPMAGSDLQAAADVLQRCAWVKEVHRIRRLPGNRIEVYAQYREPVAAVEAPGLQQGEKAYYLVDREGVRLLAESYRRDEIRAQGFALIQGVRTSPGAVGEPWPGRASQSPDGDGAAAQVEAALAVIDMLRSRPYLEQIEAVDAGRFDAKGRVRLMLLAQNGGEVEWGLPPGRESALEPSAERKLAYLDAVYQSQRAIAAPDKRVMINRDVVWIQPSGGH